MAEKSHRLPAEFKLERFFEKYEFTTKYLLSCSDAEALSMQELLDMADPECKASFRRVRRPQTVVERGGEGVHRLKN